MGAERGGGDGDGAQAGGVHVAIIMDGNGRWARARGLPRTAGHRAGAEAVRRVVEASPDRGISELTLYAFSSDNWQRPAAEVRTLLALFRRYLRSETAELVENGVRLKVIGRRDRLPSGVLRAVEAAESATANGERLVLRLAIDYSARDTLVAAAAAMGADAFEGGRRNGGGNGSLATRGNGRGPGERERDAFRDAIAGALHADAPLPDVDLLIRTGGEQRLSDFLLWECAYAELHFTPRMWPDFEAADLDAALRDFAGRERRFGRVLRAG